MFFGDVLKGLDTIPLKIGGVSDRVHLLVGLKGGRSVADVIREVKKSSNGLIREQTGFSDFNWQEGYIASQVEHHRTKSFQTELMELLAFAKIPYDPSALD